MCLKRHKERKKREKAVKASSSDKVNMQATYARAIQVAAMAQAGSAVQKRIEAIAEELKYFAPSSNSECVKIDKKITNQVDDLRAMIAGKKAEEKILNALGEIDSLIAFRKATLETGI